MKNVTPASWSECAPRLSTIAKWINENTAMSATVVEGYCSTDRKLAGTRLRHPGKGRTGNRLIVKDCSGKTILDHNSAETYRRNSEVVEWLERRLEAR